MFPGELQSALISEICVKGFLYSLCEESFLALSASFVWTPLLSAEKSEFGDGRWEFRGLGSGLGSWVWRLGFGIWRTGA